MTTHAALAGPGLLKGCKVLTLDGYTPIEELEPGSRIITRSGMRRLGRVHTSTREFRAISVMAGSLGYTRPTHNLKMAPGQQVMVRDWRAEVFFGREAVITHVDSLIDGKQIFSDKEASLHEVFELAFEEQEIFYVDGVEIISKRPVAIPSAEKLVEAA